MANLAITNSTAIGAGNTQQAVAATYKSLLITGNSSATSATVGGGAFRRGKLYDILIGTNGTPADNFMEFDCGTVTLGTTPAGITGTQISSVSSNFGLDPADNAFVAAIFDPLAQILRLTRYQTSAHAPVRRHAIAHHDNILKAITTGDPTAAREAMHAHIVQTENDMVKYVRDPAAALTELRGSDLRRVSHDSV